MATEAHMFLDSEPSDTTATNASGHHPRRLWQSYWPPTKGSALYEWLESEYPQILSWRFDPTMPFDRPWQLWTKQLPKSQQPSLGSIAPNLMCSETRTTEIIVPPTTTTTAPTASPAVLDEVYDCGLKLSRIEPEGFSYLAPLSRFEVEKPYRTRLPFLKGYPRTNIAEQAYPVSVSDVSGYEDHFELETCGFQYIRNPVPIQVWTTEAVLSIYLPMMEQWLLHYLHCEKVFIYTYTESNLKLRRTHANPVQFRCKYGRRDDIQWTNPFTRVHCDVTHNSSISRLYLHLPQEAESILKGRYRYINVWRPINCVEQDYSLALCDTRTMPEDDLVATDVLFPHFCDEAYEVKYNPRHRWYYKKGMSTDETVVFKLYDTCDTEAKFCAHSAFKDHTVSAGTPNRESIEVRAIIVG